MDTRTVELETSSSGAKLRAFGLVAGLILAAVDTYTLPLLGVSFRYRGEDAGFFLWAYFAVWFGGLGYLVGDLIARHKREKAALALLEAKSLELSEARSRLAQNEKLAALGQLAAAIAHEVKNPLAIIRSTVQNLTETLSADDKEGRKSCDFVIAEIDRLSNVSSSLLSYARPLVIRPASVSVRELLDRTQRLAESLLREKQLRLSLRESTKGLVLEADFDLICQVLLGLLANAAEASPERGELLLEAQKVDGLVELAVADSGPGVPAELKQKIFEPFFTTRANGSGLGLAVARQILGAHRAELEVRDSSGGGACFAFRLPVSGSARLL